MKFEGTYEVQAPRDRVWAFVIDPNKIGKCLPDLQSLEIEGEDKFTARVRVGIGFIKAEFKFHLMIIEKKPPSYARLRGIGTSSGNSLDMDTAIALTEIPSGTKLSYKADVKVAGAMAGLGQRIM